MKKGAAARKAKRLANLEKQDTEKQSIQNIDKITRYRNSQRRIQLNLFNPLPCHKFQYLTVLEKCCR